MAISSMSSYPRVFRVRQQLPRPRVDNVPQTVEAALEAARLAAGRIPETSLHALLSIFTQLRETGGFDPDWEHDRSLHRVIAEASGNRRLLAEISRYGDVIQTVREKLQHFGLKESNDESEQ